MTDKIDVLDKGYVRYVAGYEQPDLDVVNAARASFAKESRELTDKDISLINFLARNGHTSPFRHAFVTLEVKAPLMVARQWWKYVIGGDHAQDGWNEASRRYLTTETEFYAPKQWRAAAANRKQGSDGLAEPEVSCKWAMKFTEHELQSVALYEEAMADGVAPEQARLFLPANAQYTVWRWSTSLQSLCHFLSQRLENDAQWEIRQYARAVREVVKGRFPHTVAALVHDS